MVTVPVFISTKANGAGQEIVARVNGKALTRVELKRVQVDLALLRLIQGAELNDNKMVGEITEELALENLIQRHLVLQEAARRDITVSRKDIDNGISELRSRFNDLTSFGEWMKERDLDDQSLLKTIRDDILANRVMKALGDEVEVTEQEIGEYYDANQENIIIGEEVRLRIIAVPTRTKAEEILTALRRGENFASLARKHSHGKLAARGGDTGWIDSATLPQPLREVVGKLMEGDASRPVAKDTGEFLIVGLQGRRSVPAKNFDQARPEIIRHLLMIKRQEAIQLWLTEKKTLAKIEVFL